MLRVPLAATTDIEFAVNDRGMALLLHRGPFLYDYAWIQYDARSGSIQLITGDGALQELGLKIPAALGAALRETREVTMVEVNGDFSCRERRLTVFNQVLD